jgi:hypothetical protein
MPGERWWCWGLLFAVGCFCAGYAARTDGTVLLLVSPFIMFVLYGSAVEMFAVLRRDRDEAIRTAFRWAEKARTMDRVS